MMENVLLAIQCWWNGEAHAQWILSRCEGQQIEAKLHLNRMPQHSLFWQCRVWGLSRRYRSHWRQTWWTNWQLPRSCLPWYTDERTCLKVQSSIRPLNNHKILPLSPHLLSPGSKIDKPFVVRSRGGSGPRSFCVTTRERTLESSTSHIIVFIMLEEMTAVALATPIKLLSFSMKSF